MCHSYAGYGLRSAQSAHCSKNVVTEQFPGHKTKQIGHHTQRRETSESKIAFWIFELDIFQ